MRRNAYLTSLALALMAAPATLAHTDQGGPGTPDFTCQTPAEWAVHDYAVANGVLLAGITDNNFEECGTTYGLIETGAPECRQIEERLGMGPGHPVWELQCHTDRPLDYDGDLEFAVGGAVLAVESGDGQTSGSLVCLGTPGHHYNVIGVEDAVFSDVVFLVAADWSLAGTVAPGEPDCGDGIIHTCGTSGSGATCNPPDQIVTCLNSCSVPFGPGADGTYIVWVLPSLQEGGGGNPTGASHGHIGNGFFAADAFVDDGEIPTLLSDLLLADGGGSCCTANCLLGTCSICCAPNKQAPACTCELTGQPSCVCVVTAVRGK